jgi:hypothetical protein
MDGNGGMALAAGWLYFRAELRRRWRAWLALALIVGAFAGVVEAAAAGARRTDAAYPSLLAWSDAPDLLLFSSARTSETFGRFSLRAAAAVPQARHSAVLVGYSVTTPAAAQIIAPVTNVVPGRFWHRRILSGRLPDPGRPHEVSIAFTLAQSAGLHAGDTLRTTLLARSGRPVPYTFRITGIDATPSEFPPQTGSGTQTIWATPAFYRAHRSGFTQSAGVALRLWHGEADLPAVQRELSRLTRGKVLQNYPLSTQAVNTERSIHLQAVALWLVAALLAVISLLVLGQLLARMSFLDSVEYATLRALGISRWTLLAIGFLRAAVIGAGGAVVGTLTALAISPLLPVGLAAVAEPDPGIRADGLVLGVGVAAAVLITIAATAWPTWRAASAGPAMDGLGRPAAAGPGGAPEAAVPGHADLGNRLGPRHARHPAGVAARGGPDRGAGAQHRGQCGGGRGRAHRGAGLLGQPRAPADHAPAVRRDLGRLRQQRPAARGRGGDPRAR